MSDRIYDTYTTYACPKCGWNGAYIYDERRFGKRYDVKDDIVWWICPDCGYSAPKSAFEVFHRLDITDQVRDKEAYLALSKRLNAEIAKNRAAGNALKRLHISLDEYGLILRETFKTAQNYQPGSDIKFQGVSLQVDLPDDNTKEERHMPTLYRKTALVEAVVATEGGSIKTPEGVMTYNPGDYIVTNPKDGHSWPVKKAVFEDTYEVVPDG